MTTPGGIWAATGSVLRTEWRNLTTIAPSDRPWQMPFCAGLSAGLPLFIGCWFGHLEYGLISSLGGLVFVYVPPTPLYHRMVMMMTCAFAITACYTLGTASQYVPGATIPVLTFVVAVVMMVCRFFGMAPPGPVVFVMAASIGAYAPVPLLELPLAVGLMFMGSLLACLIVFFYSLYILRRRPRAPPPPLPPATFDHVVFDSVIIGAVVGVSLLIADVLALDRPYWVPISCVAVIQGATLRAVWTRQAHRIIGTCIGLALSWAILALPLDQWSLSAIMMTLVFLIESSIVRNYASGAVFLTPMAILLAEAVNLGAVPPGLLITARLTDTVIGCAVALAGAACIHDPRFRAVVGGWMRALIPAKSPPPTSI